MPKGGARPNSGPKPGTKYGPNKETISKVEAREMVRKLILQDLQPMIEAQVKHATGIKYLVARHKLTGQFVRLTKRVAERIMSGKETRYERIEVWQKDPSTPAFTDLLNRCIDRPKEQEQEIVFKADEALIDALNRGRKRARELREADPPVIDVSAVRPAEDTIQ